MNEVSQKTPSYGSDFVLQTSDELYLKAALNKAAELVGLDRSSKFTADNISTKKNEEKQNYSATANLRSEDNYEKVKKALDNGLLSKIDAKIGINFNDETNEITVSIKNDRLSTAKDRFLEFVTDGEVKKAPLGNSSRKNEVMENLFPNLQQEADSTKFRS